VLTLIQQKDYCESHRQSWDKQNHFVERYQQVGREVDPLRQYVLERHAPVHEELVLPAGKWKQCELYRRCCSQYDHEHVMTGPIVGSGRLVGMVNFARVSGTPATSSILPRLVSSCLEVFLYSIFALARACSITSWYSSAVIALPDFNHLIISRASHT
jgi:hypothetical protein